MCLTTLSVLVPFTVVLVVVEGGRVAGEGGGVSDDEGGGVWDDEVGGVLRYLFLTVTASLE